MVVLLALAALLAQRAMAQFESRGDFFVSGSTAPYSLVIGDFDRDGITDVAVATYPPGGIDILLGNGDGTFRQGAAYQVSGEPRLPSTASLRSNGTLDLVFSDFESDNVWVMLGNGDGTFQPPVAYAITAEAYMVVLGNLTGGSAWDIATTEGYNVSGTYECNCVEVLPGNGDGTFGVPITTPLPYGLTANVIAAGDFNDDGKTDLAAAGEAFPNYEVAVLLGNGNGTFSADGYYVVAEDPASMTTGYFTGSKAKLDLALTGGGVAVLLGNGDGTFGPPVQYTTTRYGASIVAANFGGNGDADLAVADPGDYFLPAGVTLYRGTGNGAFEDTGFYHVGGAEGAQFLAVGDFNGDGKPDLVVVNSVNSIITTLLNTGVVSFSPTTPLNFEKQAVGTTSPPQTVKLTNTGSTELKIQSIKAGAGFAVTSTCGQRVAAGTACTISATFSPTKKGAVQGTISIIDNASSKPQVIELLGTGT